VAVSINTATESRKVALPEQGTVVVATERSLEGERGRAVTLPALGGAWVVLD
jgi:hypothetical protein